DSAPVGGTVWVTNGTYTGGSQAALGQVVSNRVTVLWPLTLRSVNGPAVTIIEGANAGAGLTTRGVYLADGAVLSGFTVQKGTAATIWMTTNSVRWGMAGGLLGGGILCETPQAIVTNCFLGGTTTSNVAVMGGGGYGGTYYNCRIANGQTVSGGLGAGLGAGLAMTVGGGGLAVANAYGCTLSGNYSIKHGGGLFEATAAGCTVVSNTANENTGGGAYLGAYSNCVFSANSAGSYGGGVGYVLLDRCTLTNNSVTAGGGGAYMSTVLNSLVAGNSADFNGGGLHGGNATNSIIRDNVAANGGGIYSSLATASSYQSCVIANNYANYGGGGNGGGGTYYQCTFTNNRAEYQGGAAYKPYQLYTCLVANNSARYGGGVYNGDLYRCTVIGNHAILQGGGVFDVSVIRNSIIYYNTAPFDDNWSRILGLSGASYSCIDSPWVALAWNCFTNPPGIISLDNPRLAPGSACYNAGLNESWMTGRTDLAGNPLIAFAISDVGAFEYQGDSAQTGALTAAISATGGSAVAGAAIAFTAQTTGLVGTLFWNFGDGTSATNAPLASHAWSGPGTYTVSLIVSNVTGTATATTNVTIVSSTAAWYVSPTGNDSSRGTNWATAKKTLQAAVDAAPIGATVWVTNGSYSTGGRPAGDQNVTNVVAVEKPLTLRSLNGPGVTRIVGSSGPVPLTNQFGVRGLYLGAGASLIGFTVTNGQAGGSSNLSLTTYGGGNLGGGIFCESDSSMVSNCVVAGNAAMNGGGVSGGTLYSSVLLGNTAWVNILANTNNMGTGGGAYYSRAYGCLVSSNTAYLQGAGMGYGVGVNSTNEWNTNSTLLTTNVAGGGGFMTAFTNCLIRFNRSTVGGGISQGSAQDCLIFSNIATKNAGGANQSVINGGAVSGNYAAACGGGTYASYNYNCLIQSNTASAGGGCYGSSVDANCVSSNCVIADNRATNGYGGGSCFTKTYNSMVVNNYTSGQGGGQFDNEMRNCLVISNTSAQYGGGYVKGGGGAGGLNNCTFAYNFASTNGGGIYFNGALMITNCIIVNNSVGIPTNFANVYYGYAGTPPTYKSNLFYSCSTGVSDCVGSTTADPMFLNAAAGDFRLASDSPGIDTGINIASMTNGVDLGGAPRLQGPAMDMGAYETFRPNGGSIVCTLSPAAVIPLGAQWSIDGGVWNDSGDVVGSVSAGSHTVSFSPVTGYTPPTSQPVTVSVSATNVLTGLYVLASHQTQSPLVFNPTTPQVYGTTNPLAVSGGSGSGAVSFSVLSGPGLIVGGTNLTATLGTGTITVRATKAGDATYDAIATTNTVTAAKTGQSISFPPIANQLVTATLPLVASASSGLGVSFA
ncbi:MAG: choice-of-anchor Q domain-containing protein, partial [Verrucomicrobiota bacterium]